MVADDKTNVVALRQPQASQPVATVVSADDPISPKSLLTMTELEQNMFLDQLRERRLRAARTLKAANQAALKARSLQTGLKLEKKADQVARHYERASKALDKLEESLFALRALTLQHTDIDISDVAKQDE